MDLPAVLAQINDLPPTFTPAGNPYAQLANALAVAKSLYTQGADAEMQQVAAFSNALDGWIDLWGLLFGVARNEGEGNIPYSIRISETVLAWVGTLPAIQAWIDMFAPGGTVTELNPGPGYAISIQSVGLTTTQIDEFVASLNRIRPAGVPFTIFVSSGTGLYLGTEAFIGTGGFEGSYLVNNSFGVLVIGSTTPSAAPLIPTLYLTDPLLNPNLGSDA